MDHDSAYNALSEASDDRRWAFGTGFEDPLAGVDASVPAGVAGPSLATYCLMLGDDALVFSHRLQEWLTRLPELEEEVAVANIALDLLGQARLLLARAGQADGSGRDEDAIAFFREPRQWRNVRLVEAADADFAQLVVRLLVFSTWRRAVLDRLQASSDPFLAAVAGKGVKELAYHRDFAAGWVVRLGDGTELSHRRTASALEAVWPLVDELFDAHPVEESLVGVAVVPTAVRAEFDEVIDAVLAAATLSRPRVARAGAVGGRAGRDGVHTEALGFLLAEMQSVARAHPGGRW
ncbi:MAG TPA: 1,2-phenylacetyl-CoA epoxidase subunit PaaC [Acidimicrobiales bacterium]|nr:1,2-phenylacetyl-CoA epoxidase subunit PaaC [Acidimicrobiales bacterium]